MTQRPPKVFASFIVYGDLKGKIDTTNPEPITQQITDEIGVQPTEVNCSDGIFEWIYQTPQEDTWELPELLSEILDKLDSKRIIKCLEKYGLHAELKASAYMTDSYPVMFFPPSIIKKVSQLGAGFDLDIYSTAYPENRDLL